MDARPSKSHPQKRIHTHDFHVALVFGFTPASGACLTKGCNTLATIGSHNTIRSLIQKPLGSGQGP